MRIVSILNESGVNTKQGADERRVRPPLAKVNYLPILMLFGQAAAT
jgi:hypothetical protein